MDTVVIKELKRTSKIRVQLLYGNENKGYYGYRGDSMFFVFCKTVNYGFNDYITQAKFQY